MAVEQRLITVLDQLSDLWREKAFQAGDALRAFLRQGQLTGHPIEASREMLQLVTGRDRDSMVEIAGADLLGALLQEADWTDHATRQQIGEQRSEYSAGAQ